MRVWLRPLREHERNAAAEICWQGFEPKLGRVLCPATKGVEFLRRALQPDAGLAAVDATDRLLGVAGIKTIDSGFVYAGALLRQIYGRSGAFWRAAVLETFDRPALPGQLLIDGLCVERDHRGRGIGSCLIGGVLEIARQRGFATVRLEVTMAICGPRPCMRATASLPRTARPSDGPRHLSDLESIRP